MVTGNQQNDSSGYGIADDPLLQSAEATRLQHAVRAGVHFWRETVAFSKLNAQPPKPLSPQDVHALLSPPPHLQVRREDHTRPPQRNSETFKVSLFQVFRRLFVWVSATIYYFSGIAWDILRRRNTIERRAQRLRDVLLRIGATAIKLGQQLYMRVDLIPYAYAKELESMLDQVPPFPVEIARRAISEAAGCPIDEAYLLLDPIPVGSASVACVYQARLLNGKRVAIKVRRPHIGEIFVADMRVLHWLLSILELFYLPPGFTKRLIYELRTMLLDEVDFVKEARYTELFRRSVKKAKFHYASIPQVYFDLSNRSVLVTEFVDGFRLTEIIAAVENEDTRALAMLASYDIDPKIVASRALQIIRFSGFEGIVFNADPHPGNIFVRPDNHLVFIDFGSCGSFTHKDLHVWRRLIYGQSVGDVGVMVQATLALLEPLAPIDVAEFSRRLETIFFQDMYAFKSKHSEAWERTSANLWYAVLGLVREYKLGFNLNTLRMIRATMLSDSLAVRLDAKINHYDEFLRYERGANKRAKKRLKKKLYMNFNRRFVIGEQLFDDTTGLVYLLQRFLDTPFIGFASMNGRAAQSIRILLILLGIGIVSFKTLLFSWQWLDELVSPSAWQGWQVIRDVVFGMSYDNAIGQFANLQRVVIEKPAYQIFAFIVLCILGRRIYLRLESKE